MITSSQEENVLISYLLSNFEVKLIVKVRGINVELC